MTDERTGFKGGASLLDPKQPPVSAQLVTESRGPLLRYRVMAFVTGVVLLAGTVELIVKYAASVNPPGYALLWIGHGWLYLIYVMITFLLGLKLRWPILRFLLVMLAGTIPTMSFVAEHFVTRAARNAGDQPVSTRA